MRPLFAALMLFFGASMEAEAQQLAWNSLQTRVFVVGLLKWENSEEFESFPALNRRDLDLVNFYRQAGVPKSNLVICRIKRQLWRRSASRSTKCWPSPSPARR